MNNSLMIRWMMVVLMFVCGGCSLDPNWVNRDTNEITFTMCGIPEGQDRLYGIRYVYWIPDIFFRSHCNYSRLQYYKREDNAWIHQNRLDLRVEGNLGGDHDHYNMDIDQVNQLFTHGLESKRKFHNEKRGERFSYSLDKVLKNDMPCIRLETVLRTYRVESVKGALTVFQRYWQKVEYYCWPAEDNINHYVKIGSTLLDAMRIPDEKFERYYSHIKKINIIPEEEDEYANAPLEYRVNLEKEVLDPVFATLTIRPVSDEIKQRLDAEWRATCESRMKTFEKDYIEQEGPARYRRMYLENCGYTVM